jgi:hypothetical protein
MDADAPVQPFGQSSGRTLALVRQRLVGQPGVLAEATPGRLSVPDDAERRPHLIQSDPSVVAALICTVVFAGSALAGEAPALIAEAAQPAVALHPPSTLAMPAVDRDEQRISTLHDRLGITPSQEGLWGQLAQVMRTNDDKIDALATERHTRTRDDGGRRPALVWRDYGGARRRNKGIRSRVRKPLQQHVDGTEGEPRQCVPPRRRQSPHAGDAEPWASTVLSVATYRSAELSRHNYRL